MLDYRKSEYGDHAVIACEWARRHGREGGWHAGWGRCADHWDRVASRNVGMEPATRRPAEVTGPR